MIKRLVLCVVYRSTDRRIEFAYIVATMLQLSYLTHAELIHDVWDKADALGPLGERLGCYESVYHRDWLLSCMKALKQILGPPGR